MQPAHFLIHGVERVDYETLLKESDVVSFHVVLTKETRYMLGERQIGLMKPNAIVINTARGKVIDEAAVAKALAADQISRRGHRRLRGRAAADGFAVAGARRQGADVAPLGLLQRRRPIAAGVAWATRSVLAALNGKIPDNVYNREVLPRWHERFGGASISG